MNKSEIAQQIKETEEKLASLREELEKPNFPTLFYAKPGDMLENGCVVVEKFPSVMLALIAAPQATERFCQWSEEFSDVFDALQQEGFNKSQFFIPSLYQLKLAYNNCKKHFACSCYWSSTMCGSNFSFISYTVNFIGGYHTTASKTTTLLVRAFSLVSY